MSFSLDRIGPRQPRLRAILNDTTVLAPYSAQIMQHSSFIAGTYRLLLPLTNPDTLDWANIKRLRSRVQISNDRDAPYADLIEGYVDSVQINPVARTVSLEGRDLSASLLGAKTPADFQNLTSTEIVSRLADQHGLTPVVTNNSAYSGRYYSNTNNVIALGQFAELTSDWDIIVALGQYVDSDAYVSGRALYFRPTVTVSDTVQVVSMSDLVDIHVTRLLPLASGANVTVTSWNSELRSAVSETRDVAFSGSTEGSSADTPAQYAVFRPNLPAADAMAIAARMAKSIAGDALSVELEMLGDASLSPWRPIRLEGAGPGIDTTYRVESITRSFRAASGFTQSVRARSLVETPS